MQAQFTPSPRAHADPFAVLDSLAADPKEARVLALWSGLRAQVDAEAAIRERAALHQDGRLTRDDQWTLAQLAKNRAGFFDSLEATVQPT